MPNSIACRTSKRANFLVSLKNSIAGSIRRKNRTYPTGMRRLRRVGFEKFEERAMMIVGAFADLPAVPLNQYTGVVHMVGNNETNPVGPRCSASLLETGRHLLTAGHCIVQNEQQRISFVPFNPKAVMSGGFSLNYNGQTTAFILLNSSPAVVESALEALPNITNVDVTAQAYFYGPGVAPVFIYTVEFRGELSVADVPQMTVNSAVSNGLASVSTVKSGATRVGKARFDLPSGSYEFNPANADVVVHPLFKNLSTSDDGADLAGYDIAVITLPAIAPIGAQRYDVQETQDEVGSQVAFVGYGRTGQGSTGENIGPPDTAGVRRAGLNEIDAVHNVTGYLQTDFDDGTVGNSSMGGLGLGNLETSVVRGDSGGPGIVDGRIAGIHASVIGGGWGTFGNVLYMTRVSDFVQNRDPLFDVHDLIETPDDIVLDMNLQDAGNDGDDDLVEVQLVGINDNRVRITINGELVWSDLRSRMLSLTILGSGDDERIVIHDDLGVSVTVQGGAGDDELIGGPGQETLDGNAGNDTLTGGGSGDSINGGQHSDILVESVAGNVLLTNFFLHQTGMFDTLASIESATLIGSAGNDTITMSSFTRPATVYAGAGHDTVYGSTNGDRLYGQDGNDLLVGGGGSDTLYGGENNDQLIGGFEIVSNADTREDNSPDTLFGDDGDDGIIGDDGSIQAFFARQTIGGADVIRGGHGNDLIFGGQGADNIHGQGGNDTIAAGRGSDTVIGGWLLGVGESLADGDDYINGEDDNDFLCGDNLSIALSPTVSLLGGNDTIFGGLGNDVLVGQFLHDELHGEEGNDSMHGGVGNDDLYGGPADDTLIGDAGSDRLYGNEGADDLNGGANDDELDGGDGNDVIHGDSGNDNITGGAGKDLVRGGDGNDNISGGLIGGTGTDSISGNEGRDLLIGGRGGDRMSGDYGDDILIAGTTSFDNNDYARQQILLEWTNPIANETRVANLRGIDNPGFAIRLNGNFFLRKGETVHDDDEVDFLIGSGSTDWFLFDPLGPTADVVVDLGLNESLN
ncbi:MAG: calcium-binding protein [Pirellula sp.]